jgi:hypothetical protein
VTSTSPFTLQKLLVSQRCVKWLISFVVRMAALEVPKAVLMFRTREMTNSIRLSACLSVSYEALSKDVLARRGAYTSSRARPCAPNPYGRAHVAHIDATGRTAVGMWQGANDRVAPGIRDRS